MNMKQSRCHPGSMPGEALREIQNVKSAATVARLRRFELRIQARENKNTAMWKERLLNMSAEAA